VRLLGVLVGTDTVTAQGHSPWTRHARSGDFYLAKTGDPLLATTGDFFMATDTVGEVVPGFSERDQDGCCQLARFVSQQ
jgi:hypothetical protein